MFQKTSRKTIAQCNVPRKPTNNKPSLDNIVKNPTLIFQQPKPSTSSWNPKFYLELSSYPHFPLNFYYVSITTTKYILA